MRTKIFLSFALLLATVCGASEAYATVGGPTLLYNLRTNTQAKEIMYEVISQDGKGCPPEIYAINFETGSSTKLVDCDDPRYEQLFKNTIAKYPTILKRTHLPFNGVIAKMNVIGEIQPAEENYYIGKTDFSLDIYQYEQKKESYSFSGCKPTQPHVIEGYEFPNGKLGVIIVSSLGNCFEGGYTAERIFLTEGEMDISNKVTLESRTSAIPAIADAGTNTGNLLIVAEKKATPAGSDTAEGEIPPIDMTESDQTLPIKLVIGILLVILIAVVMIKSRK